MDKFYIGLHQPSDAKHFARCCLHIGRLRHRKKPLGCDEILLDSQAFRVLELHGEHQLSVAEFAQAARRISSLCRTLTVVTQDYMCEPYIFERRFHHTGRRFSVAEHQASTISRYDELHAATALDVLPVLQGYSPDDYAKHVLDYGSRLQRGAWVGVGSVCKRNGSPSSIRAVLLAIKAIRPDLRLHGFGLKLTALMSPTVRELLFSADSLAWSLNARKNGRSANDWREAQAYNLRVTDALPHGPLFADV